MLYGTTEVDGGAGSGGTVFALDPNTGTLRVVYSFCSKQNCSDGAGPYAGLIKANGMLYGTTVDGGANGYGTAFAVDPSSGAETVLYAFCSQQNCTDGASPYANLIAVNGTLYGTTGGGGSYHGGTVFALDPNTRAETVLHSFCSQNNCADGQWAEASLIERKGLLYSTTIQGGTHGFGTAFAVDPATGVETVIYSFCRQQSCTDGASFYGNNLLNVNGILYGTTQAGGTHSGGTVFAIKKP